MNWRVRIRIWATWLLIVELLYISGYTIYLTICYGMMQGNCLKIIIGIVWSAAMLWLTNFCIDANLKDSRRI
jgi:hypothetical protein